MQSAPAQIPRLGSGLIQARIPRQHDRRRPSSRGARCELRAPDSAAKRSAASPRRFTECDPPQLRGELGEGAHLATPKNVLIAFTVSTATVRQRWRWYPTAGDERTPARRPQREGHGLEEGGEDSGIVYLPREFGRAGQGETGDRWLDGEWILRGPSRELTMQATAGRAGWSVSL